MKTRMPKQPQPPVSFRAPYPATTPLSSLLTSAHPGSGTVLRRPDAGSVPKRVRPAGQPRRPASIPRDPLAPHPPIHQPPAAELPRAGRRGQAPLPDFPSNPPDPQRPTVSASASNHPYTTRPATLACAEELRARMLAVPSLLTPADVAIARPLRSASERLLRILRAWRENSGGCADCWAWGRPGRSPGARSARSSASRSELSPPSS
jgi:hypothetical protein